MVGTSWPYQGTLDQQVTKLLGEAKKRLTRRPPAHAWAYNDGNFKSRSTAVCASCGVCPDIIRPLYLVLREYEDVSNHQKGETLE